MSHFAGRHTGMLASSLIVILRPLTIIIIVIMLLLLVLVLVLFQLLPSLAFSILRSMSRARAPSTAARSKNPCWPLPLRVTARSFAQPLVAAL